MNRLTKRTKEGVAYLAISEALSERGQEIEGSKEILEGLYETWQKLADYEDLGLTPSEIKKIIKEGVPEWIDKYLRYRELEEQGRLIVLTK
jgi:hypothetical protein